MANVENVEEMVGTREAEVATESGGAVATESSGTVTTGDVTAGDDTAATGGVMCAAEGPYTIDVRHVEAMVGTTREAADSKKRLAPGGRLTKIKSAPSSSMLQIKSAPTAV